MISREGGRGEYVVKLRVGGEGNMEEGRMKMEERGGREEWEGRREGGGRREVKGEEKKEGVVMRVERRD